MKVTKEQFTEFIAGYPRRLETDVCGIVEPPQLSYYDFTLGEGPAAQVATVSLGEPREYRIDNAGFAKKEKEKL